MKKPAGYFELSQQVDLSVVTVTWGQEMAMKKTLFPVTLFPHCILGSLWKISLFSAESARRLSHIYA